MLLFCCIPVCAGAERFPRIIHWPLGGTLDWYKAGSREPQKVKMQLIIKPADSADTYTWQIIYGDKGKDNRAYILKPVDTAKGHWRIDERNGIIIDQYFVGDRFTSAFTVQATTIICSYYLQNESMMVDFYSISSVLVSKTGKGTEESPAVTSYGVKSFQQAAMRRTAQKK